MEQVSNDTTNQCNGRCNGYDKRQTENGETHENVENFSHEPGSDEPNSSSATNSLTSSPQLSENVQNNESTTISIDEAVESQSTNSPVVEGQSSSTTPTTPNNSLESRSTPGGSPRTPIDQIEVVLNPSRAFRRSLSGLSLIRLQQQEQSSLGSSLFSLSMTLVFVLLLWIVVFMVFGSRGHVIAGIFIALFFVGILINTCFFKFYFRLRLFLGMNAALAAAEQARLQQTNSSVKVEEPPPSYDAVDQSPPPYDYLHYVNNNSPSSCDDSPTNICPYCRLATNVYGLCESCQKVINKIKNTSPTQNSETTV